MHSVHCTEREWCVQFNVCGAHCAVCQCAVPGAQCAVCGVRSACSFPHHLGDPILPSPTIPAASILYQEAYAKLQKQEELVKELEMQKRDLRAKVEGHKTLGFVLGQEVARLEQYAPPSAIPSPHRVNDASKRSCIHQ